ncbi:calcium-activated chloride channel regulator 2 [Caerostris darwini]|uniref:Calcium-activated chloride channel regulator 2 n=1 Tax=Caerostris darwini TaxID=1538125 RepID=A0AAV4T7H4_9ARAC|nr:calcium-activated chloride channel regulator 2 [Caerostris darwini]
MENHKLFTLITVCYIYFQIVSPIYIQNNAYKGISISISESIKERDFDFQKLKAVLTKSSEFIYHATRKRSYLGEFLISLPSSWNKELQKCSSSEVIEDFRRVDVHLTDSKGDLKTKHSRGCGKEGDRIYMSMDWLNGKTENLAHQFAQQWSIYRYGIFEEEPVKSDSCHKYDNSWSPVGCYNIKINSEVSFDTGLPTCSLPGDFFGKKELKSSLMSIANSSKALHFCDGSSSFPHNPVMPTIHNNLCKGETVWSVIESSNDFKYARNLPMKAARPPSPTFKCFKQQAPHVTFAIQNSTVDGDLTEALVQIGSSLFDFLSNMAAKDSQVNVVAFSDSKDSSKPMDLDLKDSIKLFKDLQYYIKPINNINSVCISCGLQKALNATKENSFRPIIVMIAWKSALAVEQTSALVESIRNYPKNVRLHLILVEDTEAEVVPTDMIEAITSLGGLIYSLPKRLDAMASKLQIILADVVKNPSELHDRIVVVHEANYEKISEDFTDSFLTPSGGFNKIIYVMYCFPYLSAVIVQKNANCTSAWRQSTSLAGSFKCGELIEFKKETVPAKTWNYPFSYLGNPNPQYCSSVSMLLLPSKSKNSFTIKGWLSDYVINIPQNVLIIYVEIIDSAVRKFKVKAHISGPGFKSPVAIDLLDNGNGDPDVKAGDGIYSRYFTSLSQKGSYTVSVSAELQTAEDGSFFVEGNAEQISNPQQKKIIGIFYVNGPLPEIDILPPNRIADLTVISVNHEDRTAILQWTAPGDNYDSGTATAYEIKYSHHPGSLSNLYFNEEGNFLLKPDNALNPNASGSTEQLAIPFPDIFDSAVYYVVVRAIDTNKNTGDVSNIVQVYFNPSQKKITTKPTSSTKVTKVGSTDNPTTSEINTDVTDIATTEETAQTSEGDEISSTIYENNTTISPQIKDDKLFDEKFIIVLSSAGGILLLIIIINIIICCCYIKKIKKLPMEKKSSRKNSLRPPYNLNIAYQEEPNSSTSTDNYTRASVSTIVDQNEYSVLQTRPKITPKRYSYHTSRSLEEKEEQKNSELGFKLVKTQPSAYATTSLSQYNARRRDSDSESETEFKSAVPQPQTPSAKEYEIYITEDWKDLQDSMLSKIHTNTLESNDVKFPKPSGQTEKSTFQFPIQSKSAVYYIAMRAADDFGNKGLLSNTIQVVIGVETNSTSNITGLNITGNGTETSTESIQKIVSDTDDFIKCYPILAGSLGVLLIIIIINILVWTVCFRKYKKRWEKSQNEIKEEEINVKTNTEFKQSILEKSVNPHSYTNPVMAEYSNSSDTYGIIQTPTTPNLPATYALVVKKNKRKTDALPLTRLGDTDINSDNFRHKESDLGLV